MRIGQKNQNMKWYLNREHQQDLTISVEKIINLKLVLK